MAEVSHNTPRQSLAALRAGQEALDQGAWKRACTCFQEALGQEETPEAFEGLGMVSWWLDDATTLFDVRLRAYQLYRQRGETRSAARIATWLAWDYMDFRGEPAVAQGWIKLAHRLLEGLTQTAEYGWLLARESRFVMKTRHDVTCARTLAAEAKALGCSLGLIDLEMVGLALEGAALVCAGQVAQGMCFLDEATAAAVAGEMSDRVAIATTCCYLIGACNRIRDYDRTIQWCEQLQAICRRWGWSLIHSQTDYALVLIWRGAWAEAEVELIEAQTRLAVLRPALSLDAMVNLGELRRRQGRLEEALALFEQVDFLPSANLGLAALALDQEKLVDAADLVDRYLRAFPPEDWMERAAGLELAIQAHVRLGDVDKATKAFIELKASAAAIGTGPFQASAWFGDGLLAAGRGDYVLAKSLFEDAIDRWTQTGSPFETAHACLELARTLFALNRADAAFAQARRASDILASLGAERATTRARTLLAELRNALCTQPDKANRLDLQTASASPLPAPPVASLPSQRLTPRELEVLRLAAQGLSNQKIADHLVLSQHTIHRHMANILTRLGLPSRAAATAYAARHGLL